jgi:hypothetical protein
MVRRYTIAVRQSGYGYVTGVPGTRVHWGTENLYEGTEKGFRWMNNKEKRHKLDGAYTKYVTKVYVF